jgi:2-desacetyl-2-hydroxyethyl bacteriochlorophyllide A dehydrogenase
MNYIVCDQPNTLALQKTEEPVRGAGHALLQIKRVGICGTDLHAYRGKQAYFSYPRILGHELAAEVLDTDSHSDLKRGDRVVVIPYINCEQCDACRAGKTNCCESLRVFGVHVDGGMRERIAFPERLLIEANDLDWDQLVVVEPLSIGAHALRRASVKKGDLLVVLGCGPIGIGLLMLAKRIGATVVVIDVNEQRLQVAKKHFQADHIINPTIGSVVHELSKFSGGHLAQTVIDATGNKAAIEGAISLMRHGGSMVLVGLTRDDLSFHHPSLHAKESTLLFSRNATREDFENVIAGLRSGEISVEHYITHTTHFSEIPGNFPAWCSPESTEIKVVTNWDRA